MATDAEYALLATNVYSDSNLVRSTQNTLPPPEGWTQLSILPDGVSAASAAQGIDRLSDGFMASAYQNEDGKIVISYAGTTPRSMGDWLDGNIPAAVGKILARQVLDAANFYLKVLTTTGVDPRIFRLLGTHWGGRTRESHGSVFQ